MWQLLETFRTTDLRYLLIEYDESFDINELVSVFDSICKEYDKLTGKKEYDRQFEKIDFEIYNKLFINAVELAIQCLEVGGKDLAQSLIDTYNIKQNGVKVKLDESTLQTKAKNQLKSIANTKRTQLIIKAKKQKEDKKNQAVPEWEDLTTYINLTLKTNIDYNCSVAQYVSYEKSAKAVIAAREKKHG